MPAEKIDEGVAIQMFQNRLGIGIVLTILAVLQFVLAIIWMTGPVQAIGYAPLLGFTTIMTAGGAGLSFGFAMFVWGEHIVPQGLQQQVSDLW